MQLLSTFLAQTPPWVYAIFAYLLFVGLRATQTRVVSIKQVAIFPLIFTLLNLQTALTCAQAHLWILLPWIATLALALFIGWKMTSKIQLQTTPVPWTLKIPGSYFTLLLFALIFSLKYYFGYIKATDPDRLREPLFELSILTLSTGSLGLLLGRVAYLFSFARQSLPKSSL